MLDISLSPPALESSLGEKKKPEECRICEKGFSQKQKMRIHGYIYSGKSNRGGKGRLQFLF
jgi:hypothetical protein